MTELHDLSPTEGSTHRRKRVGRGPGSGKGKTSGRGQKGQKARSGGKTELGAWFEGGQMPIYRRLPKRGFNPLNRTEYQVVNVRDLSDVGADEITPEALREAGLIGSRHEPVKILGDGEVEEAYQVTAHAFSGSAKEKIEAAGGSATVVEFEG
ncbi:MAG: 50S ribosomal protein L15 [Gemmatimonadetes bacterium]|nr:50S ribosomal protein L15 [Gemmatimonadota bacterium]NIR79702.1 50S ribosomal protein L15 [Gemmatimonadota bacterium]NIT88410.1 50S ribosomal protein L15 [Gemmatimonadota bacterium]NIU32223.1 50S ribosomal protein L15 [Gemmatimonadota bacterium]NIU36768.1 50S ribosomal protein L15 [Gemmatimonadota bacterium]